MRAPSPVICHRLWLGAHTLVPVSLHLPDLCAEAVEEVVNIDLLSLLDALGNHGERKYQNASSGQFNGRIAPILVFDCDPTHGELLNDRVAERDPQTLQLDGFVSLNPLRSDDGVQQTELSLERVVLTTRVRFEVISDPCTLRFNSGEFFCIRDIDALRHSVRLT